MEMSWTSVDGDKLLEPVVTEVSKLKFSSSAAGIMSTIWQLGVILALDIRQVSVFENADQTGKVVDPESVCLWAGIIHSKIDQKKILSKY